MFKWHDPSVWSRYIERYTTNHKDSQSSSLVQSSNQHTRFWRVRLITGFQLVPRFSVFLSTMHHIWFIQQSMSVLCLEPEILDHFLPKKLAMKNWVCWCLCLKSTDPGEPQILGFWCCGKSSPGSRGCACGACEGVTAMPLWGCRFWWDPKMLGLGWFMLVYNGQSENQMDDLGVPWGTPISGNRYI